MGETVLPSKLVSTLSSAVEAIRGFDFIHVFSHYDSDGISAASILCVMLDRMGKEYQVTIMSALNDENIKSIQESTAQCIILSDIGASFIPKLEEMEKTVVVLDHHKTEYDSEKIIYANPHLYGVDGMTSACGSTLALLLAVNADEKNWDLSQIAMAGIVGDKQHLLGLSGFNTYLYANAERRGYVKKVKGSLIQEGPLTKSLCITVEPYIKGVTGDHSAVASLLKDAEIDNIKKRSDLTEEECGRLESMIATKLALQGVSVEVLESLCRDRYYLLGYDTDANTLSDLTDACGRCGEGSIIMGYFLGDQDCLLKAMEYTDAEKNKVVNAVLALNDMGLNEMEHIQYFDSTSIGSTGILCTIALNYFGIPSKPVIGVSYGDENHRSKVSARGNNNQLENGIDLSVALNTAATSVGGLGGGHRIASGGILPTGKEMEFLKALNEIIGNQKITSM